MGWVRATLRTCHPYTANLGVPPRSTGSIWDSLFPSPPEWSNKARTPAPTHTHTHTHAHTAATAPLDCLTREARLKLQLIQSLLA